MKKFSLKNFPSALKKFSKDLEMYLICEPGILVTNKDVNVSYL